VGVAFAATGLRCRPEGEYPESRQDREFREQPTPQASGSQDVGSSLRLACGAMSKQALDSERVRHGLKDILLGPGQLYEALRERGATSGP
jgi:hypothetical protein